MKTKIALTLSLLSLAACGQAPTADEIASFKTSQTTTSTATDSRPNNLADPSNPVLNGRWRTVQTICAAQAPVAVAFSHDLIFSGGYASQEYAVSAPCGVKPVYAYEVGYSGASLTMATYAYNAYNGACSATQTVYSPPSNLSFSFSISGSTLSLTQNNNCDGHGGAYVTQYTYVSSN